MDSLSIKKFVELFFQHKLTNIIITNNIIYS